jgi:uncharacterized membrane protein YdjX (TVP38/TMEM64 family)
MTTAILFTAGCVLGAAAAYLAAHIRLRKELDRKHRSHQSTMDEALRDTERRRERHPTVHA